MASKRGRLVESITYEPFTYYREQMALAENTWQVWHGQEQLGKVWKRGSRWRARPQKGVELDWSFAIRQDAAFALLRAWELEQGRP